MRVAWSLRGVLLVVTLIAYVPIWDNDFIDYDDEVMIVQNPHVMEGLTPAGVAWAWTNCNPPYWMPLTWLSFQLDAQLVSEARSVVTNSATLSPTVFHAQNVFWHLVNVQLVYSLFTRLTANRVRSFLVAALFAVHPMHVESVAWAIERKDVLMCFFGLLSLGAYVRYVEKPNGLAYLGMLLAYQASLMCKPMLLTFPGVLLLLDYWPLGRRQFSGDDRSRNAGLEKRPASRRSLLAEKVPVFLIALGMAIQTMSTRAILPMTDLTLIGRFMNALTGYECYLGKTFYPVGLAIFYPHAGNNWSLSHALAGASCLVSFTAIACWQAKRWPWLLVGWLWFAGTLVPVIGLAQGGLQAWADRFSYWPHIGLFVAIVWGIGTLAERGQMPGYVFVGSWALILTCLLVLTWVQVTYWRTSTSVWEHAVAVTTDNDFAHQHLAVCYRREGRQAEADFHLLEAARLQHDRRRRAAP
jgi:hypothetical protein